VAGATLTRSATHREFEAGSHKTAGYFAHFVDRAAKVGVTKMKEKEDNCWGLQR
jgi:hypothetical protein